MHVSETLTADIIGNEAASPKTGIYAFADKFYPLGFHLAPGYTDNTVGNALIDVAERFRGMAMIDSTFGNSTADAITENPGLSGSDGHRTPDTADATNTDAASQDGDNGPTRSSVSSEHGSA